MTTLDQLAMTLRLIAVSDIALPKSVKSQRASEQMHQSYNQPRSTKAVKPQAQEPQNPKPSNARAEGFTTLTRSKAYIHIFDTYTPTLQPHMLNSVLF